MPYFRGTNKFKNIELVPGGRLLGNGPYLYGNGSTFYVDSRSWGKGNDNYSGVNPNEPLATIAAALAKCTAGAHDYIIVLDAYDNDESTITIATSAVHIMGVSNANHRSPFPWVLINGDGSAAVFTIKGGDAANVEIAGLTLGGDASHPCITTIGGTSTNLVYGHIHHCAFAATGDAAFVAQDGIYVPAATGLDDTLIEDCTFGEQLTRDGIRFLNFYQGMIRNCLFDNVGEICVDAITGGAATGMPDVLDNKFHVDHGASEGWAVTSIASGGGFIDGNHASADFEAADANPYLDRADLNQWGLNYNVLTAQYPATT